MSQKSGQNDFLAPNRSEFNLRSHRGDRGMKRWVEQSTSKSRSSITIAPMSAASRFGSLYHSIGRTHPAIFTPLSILTSSRPYAE